MLLKTNENKVNINYIIGFAVVEWKKKHVNIYIAFVFFCFFDTHIIYKWMDFALLTFVASRGIIYRAMLWCFAQMPISPSDLKLLQDGRIR